MNIVAVYAITQISTGIVYVGSSVRVAKRWERHRTELNCGRHHATWLQRAWAKHGAADFRFTVLEECREDALRVRETVWLRSFPVTFNNLQATDRDGVLKHGAETRKKMSDSQKARFAAERTRTGGKILSLEHMELMQRRRRETVGWVTSELTRARLSASARRKPPISAVTRERLRQANLRRTYGPMSEAQKVKLRAAHLGKKLSPEHRAKIGASLLAAYSQGRR